MALLIREAPEGVVEVAGVLEDYVDLKWSRPFFNAGAMTMRINRNQYNAQFIRLGDFIMPDEIESDRNYIYMIEQIEQVIDRDGKLSEFIDVTGRSVGGMLEERIYIPATGTQWDSRQGPAESLMKFWVTEQSGILAPAERRIPRFYVDPDLGRGAEVAYKARYQTIATICEELGRAGITTNQEIGWEVYYEISTNTYRFDVIVGEDKTADSSDPVYFDIDFETALANRILTTDLERKTFAYVGGQGEGASRLVYTTYIDSSEPTGFNRKEVWVDAGNIDDENNIVRKGQVELQKTYADDVVEIDVNPVGSFVYGDDWNLGDLVTIRNTEWDLLVDARILGVTFEVKEGEGLPLITLQLGRPYPTIVSETERRYGVFNERSRI